MKLALPGVVGWPRGTGKDLTVGHVRRLTLESRASYHRAPSLKDWQGTSRNMWMDVFSSCNREG